MKKKSHAGKIGLAGVAAAAAAAAGAYYFYGSKNAAKNRLNVSAFMDKAEQEIIREAKKGVKIARAKIGPQFAAQMKSAKKIVKKITKKARLS